MDQGNWDVPRDDFRVQQDVRVRFNEIDGQNIVFSGNYLIYADIGVTEYFRALGEGQPGPYFHQYGTDIREVHSELHCAIFRAAERLTDIEISYAHLDLDTGKPTALPGSFIAEVRRFETRLPIQD